MARPYDKVQPGSSQARVRARRRASTQKALREKAERGETDGTERALVRVGRLGTKVLTGQEDLSDWDDEELRRGQKRDKNGRFQGRKPVVVAKAVHDELVKRTLSRANDLFRDNLVAAVEVLMELVKDDRVEAKDRLAAVKMITDRVMGKAPDRVEFTGAAPWQIALNAGIVSIDATDLLGSEPTEDEDDIIDADTVD